MCTYFKKILIISLVLFFNAWFVHAQEEPVAPAAALPPARAPVMKTIFWNTVFGSAWGAVIGVASYLSSPASSDIRYSAVVGTTFGGVLGYGFGIFLVVQGISFDGNFLPVVPTIPVVMDSYPSSSSIAFGGNLLMSEESRLSSRERDFTWKTTLFNKKF